MTLYVSEVFGPTVQGEGPEMWWRPGKDDQHQQQRVGMNFTGDRRPAQQGRRSARQSADDDVLWCRPLQKNSVYHSVAQQGRERQPGRQRIDKNQ